MTEAMPSPPESSSARRAQFLATEHWSLLATRSMSWNESFARSSMFLTSLSTATVALALVGSATQFGPEFVTFALVVLSITLFLGVATFVRLSQVNNEDLYWVAGMNRLRGLQSGWRRATTNHARRTPAANSTVAARVQAVLMPSEPPPTKIRYSADRRMPTQAPYRRIP